jgi:uncharacterized protein DUF4062/iSTAND domain-containing protein
MAISVFVSSTSYDLGEDCRPNAIRAIREYPAIAIVMEDWDSGFEDAVKVCKKKIDEETSHYIGIFAYRRGMAPKQLGKSITQAEFEWACCKLNPSQVAILMPNRKLKFGQTLYERAISEQKPEDTEAQEAFLKSVQESGRVCITFDDVAHIAQKVTRRLAEWSKRGIFDEAERGEAESDAEKIRLPSENDLIALGRFSQSSNFDLGFEIINYQGLPDLACFLIHGPIDFGHQQALHRLRLHYEKKFNSQPHRLAVAVGAQWQGRSLENLLKGIGAGIEKGFSPKSPSELGARLKELLKTKDALIEISDLHRFHGSLPEFANQFWNPIASCLSEEPQANRLVCLLTMEKAASQELEPFLCELSKFRLEDVQAGNEIEGITAATIFKLPELTAFTENEIAIWLREWLKKDPARNADPKKLKETAQALANTLYQETGGKPVTLYTKLKSYSTWSE